MFCFTEKVQARAQTQARPPWGQIRRNLRQCKQKQTQFLGDSFKGKQGHIEFTTKFWIAILSKLKITEFYCKTQSSLTAFKVKEWNTLRSKFEATSTNSTLFDQYLISHFLTFLEILDVGWFWLVVFGVSVTMILDLFAALINFSDCEQKSFGKAGY